MPLWEEWQLLNRQRGMHAGLPDNISIPPPRPKRKPSHPYPRKPCANGQSSAAPEGAGSQVGHPLQMAAHALCPAAVVCLCSTACVVMPAHADCVAAAAPTQDMTTARLPDCRHLAPKLTGDERLDATVAAVAQAASAAAAAAAAAVISAAGEHVRAHMQVCVRALSCSLFHSGCHRVAAAVCASAGCRLEGLTQHPCID